MKKVFEKIGGGIIITAFAAVVLIAGKASAKAAERISLDTEYTVSMESEKVYEYTFTAPQKGSFHIETECNVSDVDNASYCNVRAAFSNGDTKYWDSYIKINGTDKSAEYSIKSGSEVTLSFDTLLHGYSPSNKYELKFKVVTNVPKNFENEGNDTPSKAVKLKKNKTYKGIVNAEDKDTDWYVFKVPKTGKYRLSRKALIPKPEGYVEHEKKERKPGNNNNNNRQNGNNKNNNNNRNHNNNNFRNGNHNNNNHRDE